MRRGKALALGVCLTGLAAWTAPARAALLTFGPFPIDGLQEVPPVATPGFGTGTVTLDTGSNMLSWNIQWQDLIGDTTLMHFHGPANPGDNAGVEVNIGSISGLVSPSIGSTTISPAQAADLVAGLWYVNIHSTFKPGGEIRGQVVPAPGAALMLGLAGMATGRRRR
jgi:hypothetical protein